MSHAEFDPLYEVMGLILMLAYILLENLSGFQELSFSLGHFRQGQKGYQPPPPPPTTFNCICPSSWLTAKVLIKLGAMHKNTTK